MTDYQDRLKKRVANAQRYLTRKQNENAQRKRSSTDIAFEREVDRSQRMLERLFGFNEEDLK